MTDLERAREIERRDIVAELDAHIHDASNSVDYVIEWRRTLLIGLLQRARDEIVALREKHVEVVEFDLVRHARDAALEEAARLCERVPGDPKHGDFFAAAIRVLKGRGVSAAIRALKEKGDG